MIVVDPEKCPQNHTCPLIKLCPQEAIAQTGVGLPVVDQEKCVSCMVCVENCGMGAMRHIED